MPSYSLAFRRGKELPVNSFVVWTSVSDHLDSTRNTWDFLNRTGKVPHLLWNPRTGEVIDGIPLSRRATLLPSSGVQLGVICSTGDPFTKYPVNGWHLISERLEPLGIPEVWPNGPPSLSVQMLRSFEGSLQPGHYAANQINSDWTGIGPVDVRKINGADAN